LGFEISEPKWWGTAIRLWRRRYPSTTNARSKECRSRV